MTPPPEYPKVLFVRISDGLELKLDLRVMAERAARPGVKITKADVVREILLQALKDDR